MKKAHYKNVLAFDCETTGLAFGSLDPTCNEKTGDTFQMVSGGFIVADIETLTPIDKLYVEIKWNGTSKWTKEAEAVHGLSKQHLEKNGVDEEEAVLQIGTFITQHFNPKSVINLLGHNVGSFDRYFLSHLFSQHDLPLKFGNRMVDTSTLGAVLLGTFTSDELFEAVGLSERKVHNAMEDIEMTLEAARRMQRIFKSVI